MNRVNVACIGSATKRSQRAGKSDWIMMKFFGDHFADDDLDVDYMIDNIWIVGGPKECAEKIRNLYNEVGGFGHLLAITQDPDDPSWEHETLDLLKEEVAPLVADLV